MKKQLFYSNLKLCCGVLPLMAMSTSCAEQAKESRPNILILLLDDAGYNDFGFMGCEDLLTPNIDSLAANGVTFSNAHVSSTVSGPSRCGLLTGRYQQRGGYECNLEDTLGMNLNEETIADIFARNDYHTSIFGKWHQGEEPAYHPNNRGFEYFYGFIAGSRSYFYSPKKADRPGNSHNLQLNGEQQKFDGYLTDVLADNTVDYINEHSKDDKPLMMYVAFNAVHTPMEATKEDLARFKGHPRQKLAAMTWAVDRGIGKIIDALKKNNEYDNTLIFFLSDNGGAHNNQSRNFPLKGFKGNEYEGGHRVPFFMVYGDKFKGSYDGLTSSLDIIPTSMAAAGIDLTDTKNPLDGTNLLPYVTKEKQGEPHNILFWRKNVSASTIMGDYKLIRVEALNESRLYNLRENLDEDCDLRDEKPEIYKALSDSLKNWEKELTNPVLWDEGNWEAVNIDIHRNLMNNKKVDVFTPDQYFKKYKTRKILK